MADIPKSQRDAVYRYEQKNYDKTLIRLPKGELDRLRAEAQAAGQSLNAFLCGRITGVDAAPVQIITPEALEAAKSAAEADGQPVSDWITGAIKSQAQRDELRRKLQK